MKKKQRLAVILTAAVLALAPCAAGFSVSAEGEESTYNITVNATKAEGSAFSGYQIFKGDFSGGKLNNIQWGSAMTGKAAALLEALQNDDIFKKDGTNVFAGLTAESKAADFADIMGEIDNESAMANELAKVLGKIATEAVKDTNDAANIIGGVSSGYYLVKETTAASQTNPISLNLLRVIGENAEIDAKEDLPTLEKKIVEGENKLDANTASIGDTVNYELTSKVPDMTGYDKYFFVIDDTLSEGLTYDPESLVIMVGSTKASPDETINDSTDNVAGDIYYYVTQETVADGTALKIVFEDFYNSCKDIAPNTEITITYSAVLNNNAVIGDPGNPNTAQLTYSNNPNEKGEGKDTDHPDEPKSGGPVGQTLKDTVKTFTTEIVINKVDADDHDTKLDGVKFRLTGTGLKSVLTESGLFVKDAAGTFYMLKDGSFTEEAPNEDTEHDAAYASTTETYAKKEVSADEEEEVYVDTEGVTAEGGVLKFSGLNAGTYTITEISTLDGYNLLSAPITVTIGKTLDQDEQTCEWNYTSDNAIDENVVTIENKQGSTLPSTGGIGTKLFYLFGGMLAIGSGVLLVTKKRVGKEEQ